MEKLSETGCVYVTLAAAKTYADHERCGIEAARRQLTEYLLDARRVHGDTPNGLERWRYRRRRTGLDINAIASREGNGELVVIVSITVREDSRNG